MFNERWPWFSLYTNSNVFSWLVGCRSVLFPFISLSQDTNNIFHDDCAFVVSLQMRHSKNSQGKWFECSQSANNYTRYFIFISVDEHFYRRNMALALYFLTINFRRIIEMEDSWFPNFSHQRLLYQRFYLNFLVAFLLTKVMNFLSNIHITHRKNKDSRKDKMLSSVEANGSQRYLHFCDGRKKLDHENSCNERIIFKFLDEKFSFTWKYQITINI